jgi:hypothetical protein
MQTRSVGLQSTISLMMALTNVVLPEPVPPITKMLRWFLTAAFSESYCAVVMMPADTCQQRL